MNEAELNLRINAMADEYREAIKMHVERNVMLATANALANARIQELEAQLADAGGMKLPAGNGNMTLSAAEGKPEGKQ